MILIGLGANLPFAGAVAPEETLRRALAHLEQAAGVVVEAVSGVWLSAPVPASDQPWYRNAVAALRTELKAAALLALLHEIEVEFGRNRAAEARNAPRTLDMDLLAYDDEVVPDGAGLCLPHPRLHERAFVLYPLQEIAPAWRHPVSGRSVAEMIGDLPDGQAIERLERFAA